MSIWRRQSRVTLPGAARVELRVEALISSTRVNFQIPSSNRSLSNFGTITATCSHGVRLGEVTW